MTMTVVPSLARFGRYTFFHSCFFTPFCSMWILYIHVFVILYYCLDMLTLADYIRHWVCYKRLTNIQEKKKEEKKKKEYCQMSNYVRLL